MICLGPEYDIGARVKAPDVTDAPELRAKQVWLGNGEQGEHGDGAGKFGQHEPEHGGTAAPFAVEGLIGPVALRVPVLGAAPELGGHLG